MLKAEMIRSNFQDLRRRKAFEEKRDLPLRTIAKEAALSLETVQRISVGKVDGVRLSTINTLCRYFNCSEISDLLSYTPDKVAQ